MGKFVRQSVYEWKQFRNDIKKKTYMYEGKEFIGWDLPMHEQIRLYRIAEARIVEVANYANMADAPVANPAAQGGKSLYKRSLPNVFSSYEFVFAGATNAAISAITGSGVAAGTARAHSLGGHYIDVSTGWTGPKFGDKRFRLSFETSSVSITAGTAQESVAGPIYAVVTGSLDITTQLANTVQRVTNTSHSLYSILRDAVNNSSVPAGATGAGNKMSTFFTASIDSGSTVGGGRLVITSVHAGANTVAVTSMASATASVNQLIAGKDVLCGPDGGIWSTYRFGKHSYPNVIRIKA